MHAATAVLIGLGVGLHAAIWGVFKDAPHEGFHWSRFLRSPVIGALAALALQVALRWPPGRGGRRADVRCGVRGGAVHHRDVEDLLPHRGPVEVHHPDATRGAGPACMQRRRSRWILGALYFAGGIWRAGRHVAGWGGIPPVGAGRCSSSQGGVPAAGSAPPVARGRMRRSRDSRPSSSFAVRWSRSAMRSCCLGSHPTWPRDAGCYRPHGRHPRDLEEVQPPQ